MIGDESLCPVRSRRAAANIFAWFLICFVVPFSSGAATQGTAAVACLRRSFLVFFDQNGEEISGGGRRVIEAGAAHWLKYGSKRILLTGYTDATELAGRHQRLSEQRAGNVADILAGMGVPRERMVVSGQGMNYPRVPNPGDRPEPQNRRVEIVFP